MGNLRQIVFRGRKALVAELYARGGFPKGWTFYFIRHADDDWDEPITIEKVVVCNRWGFIGFKKPLNESMFKDGCIDLTNDEREALLDR